MAGVSKKQKRTATEAHSGSVILDESTPPLAQPDSRRVRRDQWTGVQGKHRHIPIWDPGSMSEANLSFAFLTIWHERTAHI